ncbi:MAG: hypothetical protein ACI4VH_00915 [Clostridia bacterium]
MKLIYEFRYYTMLPYDYEKSVGETLELSNEINEIGKKIIKQANNMKVLEKVSKQEEINYEMLKNIFKAKSINLEEINIKLIKEKEKFYVQVFDENSLEEKSELQHVENINKKDLNIRLNKKVKIFTF